MNDILNESQQQKIFYYFINNYYHPIRSMGQVLERNPEGKWLEYHINKIFNEGKTKEKSKDDIDTVIIMRGIRNAWYNESCLIHPEEREKRMEFPTWKIIQCHYSILSSIVALVRTSSADKLGHSGLLNVYSTLITKETLKKYFKTPINIYLRQDGTPPDEIYKWKYPSSYNYNGNMETIVRALANLGFRNKPRRVTFPHFLKEVRDWAAYKDGYIFCRLYGESIKADLDESLIKICAAYLVQAEIILMKIFDFETIKSQYDDFTGRLEKHVYIRNKNLDKRFAIYESIIP